MSLLTQGFKLEGLQVTPLTGEVSGPGGIAQLDPKTMDVLVLMAEHAGEVMLREDLLSRLWGSVIVEGPALPGGLAEHRRVLELNPDAGPEVEGEIARILILLGRDAEAAAVIAKMPEGNWRDYPLALMHRAPERRHEADAALERLAAHADAIGDRIHLAEALVYRGRREEALSALL